MLILRFLIEKNKNNLILVSSSSPAKLAISYLRLLSFLPKKMGVNVGRVVGAVGSAGHSALRGRRINPPSSDSVLEQDIEP